MDNLQYIDLAIRERLQGNKSRLPELFEDEQFLAQLQARASDSDWYHFEPKSFDGCYLVKGSLGYEVYQQDRGSKSGYRVFTRLSEAAQHFFESYW